jgi:serine phosphatase RsbU (regulator of sigma subunit)/tetratricopeptide (TPR) repeat protein
MKHLVALFFIILIFFQNIFLVFAQDKDIERLEDLLRASKNDTTKVNILLALAEKYNLESPLKARRYVQDAFAMANEIKYTEGIIKSADYLGSLYHNQKSYSQAINYYNQALSYKENKKDQAGIAESYSKLGNSLILQEEVDQGIEYFKRALRIRQSLNDGKGIAGMLTSLGSAYYKKNDYAESITYHREALALADSLTDRPLIATNLNRLGETYFRQEEFKESQRCYLQLLHLAQRTSDLSETQKAYLGLSKVAVAENDYKKAYDYYREYSNAKEAFANLKVKDISSKFGDAEQQILIERQQRELAEAEKFRQSIYTYFTLAVLAFIVVVAIIFFRDNRIQQQANRDLEQQKLEIEEQKNALEEQKSKIEIQNESINRKNDTLEATFKEIERKNKDITASINYAKRIQESMLPRSSNVAELLPEHFIIFRPRDIVSGDYYWMEERDGKIIIVALDCTGHGVPGAFMTMLGDSYLNQIIKLQGITEPSQILEELHNSIGVALNQEVTKNQDGMDVALCVIDRENKIMEFAGASRPLLVIQNGEMKSIESSKLPVGGFQKDRERVFTKHTFDISIPTCFYVYSDGFQDQFGGPKGRKFAKNRLDEVLFENHQLPMIEQKRILNKTLIDWMGDNRQMDDILVIGVKI